MTTFVKGIYRHGKIDLLDPPRNMREGRVRVLVIEEPPAGTKPQVLLPGKYGAPDSSTLEDFNEAEWHGEPEFDDSYAE